MDIKDPWWILSFKEKFTSILIFFAKLSVNEKVDKFAISNIEHGTANNYKADTTI